MIKYFLKPLAGRKFFYPLFKSLHTASIIGLNYDNADIATNGELIFLKKLTKQWQKEQKEQLVLFDVGANIGEYTLFLNDTFDAFETQIFAFEPAHKTYNTLAANVKEFSNIKPVRYGLSSSTNSATLFSSVEGDTLASLYQRDIIKSNTNTVLQEERVDLITLDEFCATNGIDTIDLLKIDVEGNELQVLEGAANMLSKGKINCIQFEFGGTAIDSRIYLKDFKDLFEKYDLQFGRILRDFELPISEYSEHLEVFHYSNFFAKKK